MDGVRDGELLSGRIKWFDPGKGFGFVTADEGGPDILLHANVLRNFGRSSIAEGIVVKILAQKTPRGLQAVEIQSADMSDDWNDSGGPILAEAEEAGQAGPLEPARVKWFDKAKGFGFANVFGSCDDVFLHADVLRRFGFADLPTGEAVCLRVADGQRGKMAVVIAPWDSAHKD